MKLVNGKKERDSLVNFEKNDCSFLFHPRQTLPEIKSSKPSIYLVWADNLLGEKQKQFLNFHVPLFVLTIKNRDYVGCFP